MKTRLVRVDIMVGLAMIFVVLGHQSFDFAPNWYNFSMHDWIYRFHMEVFIFLSSFLIRYSYKEIHSLIEYLRYIGRKFKKFFIPFLLVGVAVAGAKAWNAGLAKADFWNVLWQSVRGLLLYPMASEASFLWYIYVLFGFYLVSPLVFKLPSWLKMTLCVLSMALPLVHAGHFLGGFLFCKYTFFYFLGVVCAEDFDQLQNIKTWVLGLLSVPFLFWSVRYMMWRSHPELGSTFVEVGPQGYDILTGCMALPLFYFLARLLEHCSWTTTVLARISADCFWIYLLQMFVAWGCAYGFTATGWNDIVPFWVFIIVSGTLSIAFPILCSWTSTKVDTIGRKQK